MKSKWHRRTDPAGVAGDGHEGPQFYRVILGCLAGLGLTGLRGETPETENPAPESGGVIRGPVCGEWRWLRQR